ncbi:MAG: Dabb family protein [Clostridia bacterium]|nr:Dabb family protein [Clostridia bacterium]
MIKHTVCFKLKDNSPENCEKAKQVLLSMRGNVPQLRSIEVGVDFLHSERSYDVILQVVVDDKAALDAYQKDPYHCSVVKPHMHAVRETSVAVDFIIDE